MKGWKRRMKKLRIGIDLDGVVFRTLDKVLERYNEVNGTDYVSEQIKDWNTHNWMDGDMSVYDFFYDPETFCDLPINNDAVEVLYRLDKKHDIYIVTDTHYSCLETRMKELYRIFPKEKFSFMADRKIFVGKFKEMLMLDVLLDDKPENVSHFNQIGYGKAIMYDWVLNRYVTEADRVYSWLEFEKRIEKIEGSY
jgi:5'(3')-deoxyribonucleotidase